MADKRSNWSPGAGILCQVVDRVLTITFNRPNVLNAFSYTMLKAFLTALEEAEARSDVGAIIVTGTGRAFSAGTDLSDDQDGFETGQGGDGAGPADADFGGIISLKIFRSSKPVIAAVNGPAVGFGSTMTLPMDFRLASENAFFNFIFARRGLMPEACSTWFLPRIVGITKALDWCLSARDVPAAEAREAGLVGEVVEASELLDRAHTLAKSLIGNVSPTSLFACRRALWDMLGTHDPHDAHVLETRGLALLRGASDFREAIEAFRDKRPANFLSGVDTAVAENFPRDQLGRAIDG